MIYLYDSNSLDVYTLNSYDEKSKLTSQIINIKYSDNLKFYIAEDKDNTMYIIYKDGKKKEMSPDVIFDTIKTPDSEKIYFITTDYKLCYKKEVGVKEEVESDVEDYEVLNDKEIVFTDIYNSLFIKKYGYGTYKICSDITEFKLSPDNKLVAYVSDGSLYVTDVRSHQTEKLAEHNNNGGFEFADDNSIVYFDDFDSSNDSGDIYYRREGNEKVKLASECCDFKACSSLFKRGIYYITAQKTLFYEELNKDSQKPALKIMDSVKDMVESDNGGKMFVCDDMNNIYEVNSNGLFSSICENVQDYRSCGNNIAILDKDGSLYFGNKKIAMKIRTFDVFKNNIAYITDEGKICIFRGEKIPVKVVDSRCDYHRIVYNNQTLFHEDVDKDELTGCWRFLNDYTKEVSYYKFDENMNVSISDYNHQEQISRYSLQKSDNGRQMISIGNMTYEIDTNDEDKINLKDCGGNITELKKVTQDEYDEMKELVSKIYPAAEELYGNDNFSFVCVENINGFNYYLYRQKGRITEEYSRDIYINQYGSLYVENDSSMVPKKDSDLLLEG